MKGRERRSAERDRRGGAKGREAGGETKVQVEALGVNAFNR